MYSLMSIDCGLLYCMNCAYSFHASFLSSSFHRSSNLAKTLATPSFAPISSFDSSRTASLDFPVSVKNTAVPCFSSFKSVPSCQNSISFFQSEYVMSFVNRGGSKVRKFVAMITVPLLP